MPTSTFLSMSDGKSGLQKALSSLQKPALKVVTMKNIVDKYAKNDMNDPLVNILRVLQKDFNCTVVTPPDGQYGNFRDGRWNGMLGMVIRGDADVSLANLGISYDRFSVVEFSQYLDIEAHRILSVVPQHSTAAAEVMHAFNHITGGVWGLLAASILITLIVCFVAFKLIMKGVEPSRVFSQHAGRQSTYGKSRIDIGGRHLDHIAMHHPITVHPDGNVTTDGGYFLWYKRMAASGHQFAKGAAEEMGKQTPDNRDPLAIADTKKELSQGFFHYLRSLNLILYSHVIGQGSAFTSRLNTSRVAFTGFVWTMFFFRNFFTGLIQTDLVVQNSEHLIDDLEDILNREGVFPVVQAASLVLDTFEKGDAEGPYGLLWSRMKTQENGTAVVGKEVFTSPEFLDRMMTYKYVAVRSEPGIMEVANAMCEYKQNVKIHMSAMNLFDRQHGMVYNMDLDLAIKKRINYRLQSLVQSGIYGHWLDTKFGNTPECFDHVALPDAAEVPAMQLGSLNILFQIMAISDAVAVGILILEILLSRYMRRRKARKEAQNAGIKQNQMTTVSRRPRISRAKVPETKKF